MRRILACGLVFALALLGCGGESITEQELMTRLQNSGLSVERLSESTITSQQRDRLGEQPENMFSVRISNGNGSSQSMTLVQFDKDWKAQAVGDRGVNGFAVYNWFFVGVISTQIRQQIEAALL